MKKLLWILPATIFATTAFAQVSVINESSRQDSNVVAKTSNISNTVDKDLYIILDKGVAWKNTENKTSNKINKSKNELEKVINLLTEKNDEYMIDEEDPVIPKGGKTATYKSYAKIAVPMCYGNKPRLTYNGKKWLCKEAIPCDALESDQTAWDQISNSDGDATCLKPRAAWAVAAWQGCRGDGKQVRIVSCKLFGDSKGNTPTGAIVNDDACAAPTPLKIRDCAQY